MSRNNTNISKAMGLVSDIKIGHRVTSAIDGSCMDDLLEDLVGHFKFYSYRSYIAICKRF